MPKKKTKSPKKVKRIKRKSKKKTKSQKGLLLISSRIVQLIFGKNRRQQIGSSIMILAAFLLFYIYYPLILLFFPVMPAVHSPNRITIPKINVAAPIIWGVDPFNSSTYHEALTHGVAQAKGTSYPAQSGTMYIFAHSSDFPWRITRYNVIFFRLDELKPGDKIIVTRENRDYIYKVRELRTVLPSDIQYLTKETRTQLILQTCTPVGTDWFRLLVFADPVK